MTLFADDKMIGTGSTTDAVGGRDGRLPLRLRFFAFAFFGAQFRGPHFGGAGTAIAVGFYGAVELVVTLRNCDLGAAVDDREWTTWDWTLITMHIVYSVAVIGIVIAATVVAVHRKKVAAFAALVMVVVLSMPWTEEWGAWWRGARQPPRPSCT
jgi:hypothetical protein